MLTVDAVRDTVGFEALKGEWNELLEASACNSLFLTWEWLFTWWKHLPGGKLLHLIIVRSEGELVAIAPLALRPCQLSRLLPFRAMEFLGTGSVGSDDLDIIVRHGKEREALQALAGYLAELQVMVDLSHVVDGASRHAVDLASRLKRHGWVPFRTTVNSCPFINLSGHCWESYLSTLGKSHRENLRRRLKELPKRFDVRLEEVRTEEQRRQAMPVLLALHCMRWRGRGGSKALHTPPLVSFHEELSRSALQRGWLRLYVLQLDGKPAAAIYGFRYNDIFYFYQAGFDPGFARYSVGLVTLGLTIKNAIEEGIGKYDLLQGQERYKYLWARDERKLVRLEVYPPRARGVLCKETMKLRRGIKKLLARFFLCGFHGMAEPARQIHAH